MVIYAFLLHLQENRRKPLLLPEKSLIASLLFGWPLIIYHSDGFGQRSPLIELSFHWFLCSSFFSLFSQKFTGLLIWPLLGLFLQLLNNGDEMFQHTRHVGIFKKWVKFKVDSNYLGYAFCHPFLVLHVCVGYYLQLYRRLLSTYLDYNKCRRTRWYISAIISREVNHCKINAFAIKLPFR